MEHQCAAITQDDILHALLALIESVHEYDTCNMNRGKYTKKRTDMLLERIVVRAMAYVEMRDKSAWSPPSKRMRLGDFFVAVKEDEYAALRTSLAESHAIAQHPDWYTKRHISDFQEDVHAKVLEHAPHRRGSTSDADDGMCTVQ